MYSQNREEEVILNTFKNVVDGRFLDIGAFHPFQLSNTRALYELGWSGVFVEPGKKQLSHFYSEYSNVERIKICDKAIASVSGELTFYATPDDALSTLSTEHLKKWHHVKFETTTISAITPQMLFEQYGYDFDFIDLDIEGDNWKILQQLPFDKLQSLKLICIEYDDKYSEVVSFMNGKGFTQISKNHENVIMKKI